MSDWTVIPEASIFDGPKPRTRIDAIEERETELVSLLELITDWIVETDDLVKAEMFAAIEDRLIDLRNTLKGAVRPLS